MKSICKLALVTVSLAALIAPIQVVAQTTAPAADDATDPKGPTDADIIVTGTLIRGTTVTGSQTITVDSKAITDKAPSSTNELLSLIPQIANQFNGRFEGDPRGYISGISTTRPNLRAFPSANQTSGALTLVLMDGMRLTPVGVSQASPDVDIIPTAVLAGVDVVTDGGTSLYGADAVAGVLNFRTLRKFDGLKLDGNFGFGTTIKGYRTWDATVTAGKSWSSGNAYISATHAERNEILNGPDIVGERSSLQYGGRCKLQRHSVHQPGRHPDQILLFRRRLYEQSCRTWRGHVCSRYSLRPNCSGVLCPAANAHQCVCFADTRNC